MALKVKAQERLVKLGKNPEGRWMFVMTPEIYGRLNEAKVLREASLRSGISQGAIQAAWTACGEVIRAWATEGHSVAVPGLGTMRFGLRSTAVEKVGDISTGLIISRKVIFTPSVLIKKELSETSVSITCYNRKGEEVKHITSHDGGKVEDPENPEEHPVGMDGKSDGNGGDPAKQPADPGKQGDNTGKQPTDAGKQDAGKTQQGGDKTQQGVGHAEAEAGKDSGSPTPNPGSSTGASTGGFNPGA